MKLKELYERFAGDRLLFFNTTVDLQRPSSKPIMVFDISADESDLYFELLNSLFEKNVNLFTCDSNELHIVLE